MSWRRNLLRSCGSVLLVTCATAGTRVAQPPGGEAFLSLDRELASLAGPLPPAATASEQEDAAPSSSVTDVFVLLGARRLDDSTAWDMLDEPVVFGVEFANRRRGSWFGFEGGFQAAYDDTNVLGVDVSDLFLEFYLGGRITGDLGADGRFHPYLGLGGTLIYAEVTGEAGGLSVSDDDTSLGLYGHAGVYVRLGQVFQLGLDARAVTGTDVSLFGIASDADYTQLALLLGWTL